MDLNRWGFHSGLLPESSALENYRLLEATLRSAAQEISAIDPEYARRMIADRLSSGGKFYNVWGPYCGSTFFPCRPAGQLDQYGYVLPEFQWPWPERGKWTDTAPFLPQGSVIPEAQPKGTTGGSSETRRISETISELPTPVKIAGGVVGFFLLRRFF
jgi:hypothetical protein